MVNQVKSRASTVVITLEVLVLLVRVQSCKLLCLTALLPYSVFTWDAEDVRRATVAQHLPGRGLGIGQRFTLICHPCSPYPRPVRSHG